MFFSVEALADKIVEMLDVKRGQVIWIWASTHSLDLIQALALRIRMRGAFWCLRPVFEPLLPRIGLNVPEEYLGLIPEHELRWLDDVSAIVEVRDHGPHVPGVPLARRRAMVNEWIALIDAAAARGIRRLRVMNPTPALADACGIPHVQFQDACWCAVNVDYAWLNAEQARMSERLGKAEQVRITSALGTDLSLRVGGRTVYSDRDSLPRGEVYVAPLEDSGEGVLVVDRVAIRGQCVEQLRLTFEKGRVAQVDAPDPQGAAALKELLAACSGDKDRLGEFGVGLNPGITEPIGDAMIDEKIRGSIHIALGMNESFGGENRSNLHLDLIVLRPSVWLDDAPWITDGVLA